MAAEATIPGKKQLWKRILQQELPRLREATDGISCGLRSHDDPHHWVAILKGPVGTPYEDGIFQVEIVLPADYPFRPPVVRFLTPIIHCNIGLDGQVFANVLQEDWSPGIHLERLLIAIQSLLNDPNPLAGDPNLCALCRNYPKIYEACCRVATQLFTI